MMQIQINEIDNGYIVALPPRQQGELPVAHYCEDIEAVVVYLHQIWPRDVKGGPCIVK